MAGFKLSVENKGVKPLKYLKWKTTTTTTNQLTFICVHQLQTKPTPTVVGRWEYFQTVQRNRKFQVSLTFQFKIFPCVLFPVGPAKEAKRAGGLANPNYTPSVIMAVSQRMRLIIRPNVLIGGRGEVVGGEIGWGREGGAIRRQHGQTDEILTTKPHIHTHTHKTCHDYAC